MKKFILSLLAMFIFCTSALAANTKNIKFVQVTDAHLSASSEYTQKVLKSAVADINTLQDVSFVVFTGDNINNPDEKNLKAFLKIVKKLKVPYYIAIGDHDVYKANGLSKVRYYDMIHENNWFMYRHQPNFKFKKKGFVFLIVDGAKEIIPGSVGYYREGTLEWLEQELVKNENEDVIIFQHFPVVYPDNSEASVKSHKTYKVEEYKELLDKHHNVLAVLSGHFHSNSENMTNGVYHISTPSLIALPQSYKVIDIVTTKDFSPIIYTQLREFEVKE
jgi:3',5'-cyclic AMP phosphodiesterase CpdA